MSDRRRWGLEERARERASRQAEASRETFPGTHRGDALPSSPTGRTARAGVPAVTIRRDAAYGEAITVSTAAGQIFDGGGTTCEWVGAKSELKRAGFADLLFPTDRLIIPRLGYWRLDVSGRWDSYTRGGTVQVLRAGTVLWEDRLPFWTGYSRTFDLGVCEPGETVQVVVSPVGEAGAQPDGKAGTFTASLVLVELPVGIAPPPGWTPVFAGAVYELLDVDGDWWGTQGHGGLTVTRYNSSWQVQQTFTAPTSALGLNRVRGITYDGSHLWVTGAAPEVFRLDPSDGSTVDSFGVSAGGSSTAIMGITFDGTDLWLIENNTREVRRYSTGGSLLQSFSTPDGVSSRGMVWHDGSLWIVLPGSHTLARVNPSDGSVQSTVSIAGSAPDPTGVWITAGGRIYITSSFTPGVWFREGLL